MGDVRERGGDRGLGRARISGSVMCKGGVVKRYHSGIYPALIAACVLLFSADQTAAQFHFGLPSAVKSAVKKLKSKTGIHAGGRNQPPAISSLTAAPTDISTGAVTTLTCLAADPDADALSYTWSAASGTLSAATGNPVNWTAPAASGTYTVSCAVSDGYGGSDQAGTNITAFVGEWVLVPGNTLFGTSDFYVMKYEAKNVGGEATSQADGAPWGAIDHPSAVTACAALGSGAHLLTIPEVQTINRNIEAQTANWADGVIGSLVVSNGGLKRGNAGLTDSASYDGADPESGTGRNIKAKLVLSNGSELWDWSGNVWEWIYGAGAAGILGTPDGVTFASGGWYDWNNTDLNEERPIAGPSDASWTSGNGTGVYYGISSAAAVFRGGYWLSDAGAFTFYAGYAPSFSDPSIGFRCGR